MRRLVLAPFCAALLLSACGGGGGGDCPAPVATVPVTVALPSLGSLDGWVDELGEVDTSESIVVGDWPNAMGTRTRHGFVSFDLTAVPTGARVTSARLNLVQFAMEGTPFVTLGVVIVDQVVYGSHLEATAYATPYPHNQAFTVLSSDTIAGPKDTSVLAAVQLALDAGEPRAQFRLRFAVADDGDTSPDYVRFFSAETANTPDQVPLLEVTYVP